VIIVHYEALKTRLELAPTLAESVHDSARLDKKGLVRDNYLIAFVPAPTSVISGRFTGIATYASELDFIIDLKAVGTSATMAGGVMDAALGQVLGHELAVAGRQCTPIELDDSQPAKPDTAADPPLFFIDASVRFISRPA
jgi:hypothetical protein